MNKEVAIKAIQDFIGWFKEDSLIRKALEMAIQALSQVAICPGYKVDCEDCPAYEPCDDAISRQAVTDTTICDGISCNECSFNTCEDGQAGCLLKERVDKLPSVNPQYTGNEFFNFDAPMVKKSMEQDAVSRDFQIGDEVRIIGSDPIYDDCDVGWVIRNASEKVKTMYVMRNDGSAGEEAKAEWYKTGRHNAMLAEVIKALPSVNSQIEHLPKYEYEVGYSQGYKDGQVQKSGKWIKIPKYGKWKCSKCDTEFRFTFKEHDYCPNCGCKMESEDKE